MGLLNDETQLRRIMPHCNIVLSLSTRILPKRGSPKLRLPHATSQRGSFNFDGNLALQALLSATVVGDLDIVMMTSTSQGLKLLEPCTRRVPDSGNLAKLLHLSHCCWRHPQCFTVKARKDQPSFSARPGRSRTSGSKSTDLGLSCTRTARADYVRFLQPTTHDMLRKGDHSKSAWQ